MKKLAVMGLTASLIAACSSGLGGVDHARSIPKEEKHRLYSAAMAASESPLDSELFKRVCTEIGIYDTSGKPNDKYLEFVAEHVNWSTSIENDPFREGISSKDKARDYIARHLPR